MICWSVFWNDLQRFLKVVGAVVVYLVPGYLATPYVFIEAEFPLSVVERVLGAFFASVVIWAAVLFGVWIAVVVLHSIVDRYTDVWSECGEHGSQDSVECEDCEED